jgi:hypothetical protein
MDNTETKTESFDQWALLELFGHKKIVGRVRETNIGGGAFIRVDVPAVNGEKEYTRYYNPSAIYSLNPVSEEVARALVQTYHEPPVHRYEMPLLNNAQEEEETGPISEFSGSEAD